MIESFGGARGQAQMSPEDQERLAAALEEVARQVRTSAPRVASVQSRSPITGLTFPTGGGDGRVKLQRRPERLNLYIEWASEEETRRVLSAEHRRLPQRAGRRGTSPPAAAGGAEDERG